MWSNVGTEKKVSSWREKQRSVQLVFWKYMFLWRCIKVNTHTDDQTAYYYRILNHFSSSHTFPSCLALTFGRIARNHSHVFVLWDVWESLHLLTSVSFFLHLGKDISSALFKSLLHGFVLMLSMKTNSVVCPCGEVRVWSWCFFYFLWNDNMERLHGRKWLLLFAEWMELVWLL